MVYGDSPSDRFDHPKGEQEIQKIIRLYRGLRIALKLLIIVIVLAALIIGLFFLVKHLERRHSVPLQESPIPLSIRNKVPFNVYYPISSKLPKGYYFDAKSLSATNITVVFDVKTSSDQSLIFSEQAKPSASALQIFYSRYMPLHFNFKTSVGNAGIGVINNRTVASLPTNTNTWILLSAPSSINQTRLRQTLSAIRL